MNAGDPRSRDGGEQEFQGSCTAGDGSCDTDSKSMGTGFCNFSHLGWNTQTPLSPSSLQNQRILNSSKVGREEEGVSSTRPELVALAECLEDHEDDVSLLYLTDSETILQAIRSTKQFGGSNILINTTSHSVDRLRGETQSLQITL